ncbi:MAG TPA: hypothetical protein PKX28_04045 [Candidatus Hydrogenedentes bacterium]|nr:hypothetical protein [Candidatus Hydrogenedentota bacterium]
MTRWKKVLWFALRLIVALALLVVLFVGPWPVYRDSHFRDTTYYREACRAIDLAAAHAEVSSEGGPLKVGWAVREITPAGEAHGRVQRAAQ